MEVAVSDRAGVASLTLREDFVGGAETGNAAVEIAAGTDDGLVRISVPAVRLDDLLERPCGGPDVSVIKVDIEGHEDRFLAGCRRTLAHCRPVVFIEWNRVYYQRRGVDPDGRGRAAAQRVGLPLPTTHQRPMAGAEDLLERPHPR